MQGVRMDMCDYITLTLTTMPLASSEDAESSGMKTWANEVTGI